MTLDCKPTKTSSKILIFSKQEELAPMYTLSPMLQLPEMFAPGEAVKKFPI
jgi:hypothetical protein